MIKSNGVKIMILTVTMNPSIDMSYPIDHLKIDDVNRVMDVDKTAGGKGLNVARVIALMKRPVMATGMIGGHFGEYIKDQLTKDHIEHNFFQINQESRNSIAILHDGGDQTELLESGPTIFKSDAARFKTFFEQLIQQYTVVTMSGSLPQGLEVNFYSDLIKLANKHQCKVILDTSGQSLINALHSAVKPVLIKPNEEEVQALIQQQIDLTDNQAVKKALQEPIFEDVSWIVISLGAKGAFVKHDNKYYRVQIPKITVKNPVGSGDSTLAGLAMAIDQNQSSEETLKMAMTMGLLNTMQSRTGFVDPTQYQKYHDLVRVVEV